MSPVFWGRAETSISNLLLLRLLQGGVSLQIASTERPDVQNPSIHPHHCRRLLIDSHRYRNRSDQLNLQLSAVTFGPRVQSFKTELESFKDRKTGTRGQSPRLVPSGWWRSAPLRCMTCELARTAADKSGEFGSAARLLRAVPL